MTDLTSVSTFGWYTETIITNELEPISTFGWFLTQAGLGQGDPDKLYLLLSVNTLAEIILEK